MGLYALSALITFLLQTTVEWGFCLLLVHIARSPRVRFRLWLALFVAMFLQWARILGGIAQRSLSRAQLTESPIPAVSTSGHAIVLSPNWEKRAIAILVVLVFCYGVVLCGLILRSLWSRFRLKKALGFRVPPSDRLSRVFQEVSLFVPSRDCKLSVLSGLTSPGTLGWRRPQIVVPPECEGLDIPDLEAVFWHELTHIQRGDVLWNAIVRGCRNLLWFHPCIHHALSAISIERELACDRTVVEDFPVRRDSYASCLLRFARLSEVTSRTSSCIELTSGTGLLDLRVRSILADPAQPSFGSKLQRGFAGFAILSAMCVLAPALNLWFTTVHASQILAPLMVEPIHKGNVHAKSRLLRRRQEAEGVGPTQATLTAVTVPAIARNIDPRLAASHKVGVDVLVQYGNSQEDKPDGRESGNNNPSLSAPHGTVTRPSWTAVAMGAAERLKNVDFDHDRDRH